MGYFNWNSQFPNPPNDPSSDFARKQLESAQRQLQQTINKKNMLAQQAAARERLKLLQDHEDRDPERHIDATHHPHWTRLGTRSAEGDGLALFRNAVRYVQ